MKLRILSYNIHKGFDHFGFKATLEQIRFALRSTDADLLFLQEVVGANSKLLSQQRVQFESQFEFLADQNWPHFSYGKNAVFPNHHHGNAILSRHPILQHRNIDISTNRLEQRGLLHAVIELNKKPVHLLNTHLDLFERGRRIQMSKILNFIHADVPKESPLILAGDFNDWAGQCAKMIFENSLLEDCHFRLHGRLARSFPSLFPVLSLDRIYVRSLGIEFCEVFRHEPWGRLSDHLPLLCELNLED